MAKRKRDPNRKRGGYQRMPAKYMEISEWGIAAWSRDSLAELPPERVYLRITFQVT